MGLKASLDKDCSRMWEPKKGGLSQIRLPTKPTVIPLNTVYS